MYLIQSINFMYRLIAGWPNTYTYTKCLAEDLVKTMSKDLPVTIFRPAIVIPTYKEPGMFSIYPRSIRSKNNFKLNI